jgi:hypothetical protein
MVGAGAEIGAEAEANSAAEADSAAEAGAAEEEPGTANREGYSTIFAPFIESTICLIKPNHKFLWLFN